MENKSKLSSGHKKCPNSLCFELLIKLKIYYLFKWKNWNICLLHRFHRKSRRQLSDKSLLFICYFLEYLQQSESFFVNRRIIWQPSSILSKYLRRKCNCHWIVSLLQRANSAFLVKTFRIWVSMLIFINKWAMLNITWKNVSW